jgi:hypothetical protein
MAQHGGTNRHVTDLLPCLVVSCLIVPCLVVLEPVSCRAARLAIFNLYRWPNGTNTVGRPGHGTKKHGPGTARPVPLSASAGHDPYTVSGRGPPNSPQCRAWATNSARSVGPGTTRLNGPARRRHGPAVKPPPPAH